MNDLEQYPPEYLDSFAAWAHAVAETPNVIIVEDPEPDANAEHGSTYESEMPSARATRDLRTLWAPHCVGPWAKVKLFGEGSVTVRASITDAVLALNGCLAAHGYATRKADTGAYNCRQITGGTGYSLHAYGTALDINWSTNPYGKKLITDMPAAMVTDIKAIRTISGVAVWRWGGDYSGNKDAMHFEVIASPAEIAAGVAHAASGVGTMSSDPLDVVAAFIASKPLLREGDRSNAVAELWDFLEGSGVFEDGMRSSLPIFGPATNRAVIRYQASRNLEPDGKVGPLTWSSLIWEAIARMK